MLSNAPEFVVLLLGLMSSVAAVAVPQATPKQGQTFQLFAYGNGGFSGYPVFYHDGMAYVGLPPSSGTTTDTSITFTTDQSNPTSWSVAPNNDSLSFTDPTHFYIVPSGAMTSTGFAIDGAAPSGAVTSGFGFMGTQVIYTTSSGDVLANFWVTPTGTENLWQLKWNAQGSDEPGSTPATVKKVGPSITESPPS